MEFTSQPHEERLHVVPDGPFTLMSECSERELQEDSLRYLNRPPQLLERLQTEYEDLRVTDPVLRYPIHLQVSV